MPSDPAALPEIRVEEIRARLNAATPGPWQSLREGNQYLYGDKEHCYLPTAICVGASRVDGLPRVWNPHAVIGFLKFDAAWVSRFKNADADFIANAPDDIHALLADRDRLQRRVEELEAANVLHPRAIWYEDIGPVLWWLVPISEPPYAGTPLDDEFPEYVTHWTRFPEPTP